MEAHVFVGKTKKSIVKIMLGISVVTKKSFRIERGTERGQ
ncbi:MAG: hypothetical protein ACI87E_001512 [Mariniblastus sp.]|jgi:hypothetical protein